MDLRLLLSRLRLGAWPTLFATLPIPTAIRNTLLRKTQGDVDAVRRFLVDATEADVADVRYLGETSRTRLLDALHGHLSTLKEEDLGD